MSSPLQVGIIGCGWMGGAHAGGYAHFDDIEVVAAADFDSTIVEEFAAEYDVPSTYRTHEEMLAGEELDIVSVCTWQGTHARLTIDACEAGVAGVFCEKPMATNMGEARDMLAAAERNDVVLTISHQRRYSAISETVRELISDGEIGKPEVIRAAAGDGLLNWGTHLIDLSRFFLGDPAPQWVAGHVERETDRYERGEPAEDRCIATVAFEGGTRLYLEMDVPEPDPTDHHLQCYGSEGVLDLNLGNAATVTNADGRTVYEPDENRDERRLLLEEFLEVLRGDRADHRCDASEAIPTMEIMMGLYDSVRLNRVIELPVQTRENPLELLRAGKLAPIYPGRYDIRRPYESIRERD